MSDQNTNPTTDTASAEAEAVRDAMAAEEAAAPLEPTTDERVLAAEAERDEMREKLLRALAEAENVRRRAERDRRDGETYGMTRLARDLLAVHDNLERTLQAADENLREQAKAFIEGVELTQRELLNAFGKYKIEKVTPTRGEKFDPNKHQAMFEAPVPGVENGAIIEVMQDGFMIAERLLRPALVGVAKGVPAPAAEPKAADEGEG